jgi:branched-chain amino acid transport system ATP-binding protein
MPLLTVHNVSVHFEGLVALESVSLNVDEGEVVGLIGPNGAGKTTLFNVISGLQSPTGGSLTFAGEDISNLAPHKRARLGIARTFQNLGLMMDESVETNVLAGQYLKANYHLADPLVRPSRWLRTEQTLLDSVGPALESFGLEDQRHAIVSDLPFASAREVELATALIQEPRLLLLDEPTTGLDPGEVDSLREALKRVREDGRTILLIAHDVGFVMSLCNRVFVLASGRVLFEGPPKAVQRDPSVIEAYLAGAKR